MVANAITAKGVTTATDATFATMANNINSISIGPALKEQSKNTTTYNLSPNEQVSISLIFENLSVVLGVKSITISNYWANVGSTGNTPLSISGNTVSFTARNQLSNGNTSFYANIVAVGY